MIDIQSWSTCLGINIFLKGVLPYDDLPFRECPLSFSPQSDMCSAAKAAHTSEYPALSKSQGGFTLDVEAGNFRAGEITVLLGQNGSGKTTLVKMLARALKPDSGVLDLGKLTVSHKPQEIKVRFQGTVRELLLAKIEAAFRDLDFQFEVVRPMAIEKLYHKEVTKLSGGELQRLAIVLYLGRPADVYLIDEPSAYLDVEQRIVASQVIKRFVLRSQKTAFVVEHDFVMASYLADRVIVYEGTPGVRCLATAPQPLLEGMNRFLAQLQVSFRRDGENFRPRINKPGSVKDRDQKQAGMYFVLEE